MSGNTNTSNENADVVHGKLTIRLLAANSLNHSAQVVLAAFLLALTLHFFAQPKFPGFVKLESILLNHACEVNSSFAFLALGIATLSLCLVASPWESVSLWLGENLVKTLSHLILGGLGFGLGITFMAGYGNTDYWLIAVFGYLMGFGVYAVGLALSDGIQYTKDTKFLLLTVTALGFLIGLAILYYVGQGVFDHSKMFDSKTCKTVRH